MATNGSEGLASVKSEQIERSTCDDSVTVSDDAVGLASDQRIGRKSKWGKGAEPTETKTIKCGVCDLHYDCCATC